MFAINVLLIHLENIEIYHSISENFVLSPTGIVADVSRINSLGTVHIHYLPNYMGIHQIVAYIFH